ncbi:MAG: ACT domain-containing protein [Woeseiaceae bacterium]|nr:ACT domain-containing protein [Woeseiaceae bacterium]
MSQLIVLSAIGSDRAGIVQDISKVILSCGGNIEESRMTTLGSEFAVLMLVSGNWHTLDRLERGLDKIRDADDLTFAIRPTNERPAREDLMPYMVDVISLDQQGIVFNISNFFASREIEIADVATRRYSAAHTGSPMFAVQMSVNVPNSVNLAHLRDDFADLCDRMNLDGILDPVKA